MSSAPLSEEKRRFTRIIFHTPGTLSNEVESWTVEIQDLSLKGCMLTMPQRWNGLRGKKYQLSFHLENSADIAMDLVLAHCSQEAAGFQCLHIDLDSICELRRLVELNLGNSQILERDLRALCGHPVTA